MQRYHQALIQAFDDIEDLAVHCRFRNCGHGDEPGCAVRDAVETGAIGQRRYRSYVQLRDLMDRLTQRRRGY